MKILDDLKLYALQAVSSAEAWAREQLLTNGKKVLSLEKEQWAVEQAVTLYRSATAAIPILNVSTWDDEAIKIAATHAVRWAFAQLENVLNSVARSLPAPVTDAPELPEGGLQ
jgi:hypothetical protein